MTKIFSRREALSLTAGGLGALMMYGSTLSSSSLAQPPRNGLLKKRIKSRTFNAHVHLTGLPRSLAPNPAKADSKPFDPLMPLSDQDRKEAIAYWSRFKYGILEYDSKEQEDFYIRKYIHTRRNASRGTFEDNAERYLREMDEAGIDTSILLFLDYSRPLAAIGVAGDPDGSQVEPMLAAIAQLCKKHPGRFVPFAGIDVRRGKDGVKMFEKAVTQYGFKGFGELVGTLWQTKLNNRELCYPFFEKALEFGTPVMIDATMDRGFSDPALYEDILRDFPKLKICAGGAGIRVPPVEQNGKTVTAYDRMLQLAERHENLWLDVDDWQVADQKGIHRYLDYLRRAFDGPARNRIMFGSDFPIFEWMYTEKEWIEFILKHVDKKEIRFTEEELTMFFSRNTLKFLGLKN